MARGIWERAAESFGTGAHEDLTTYLGWLRDSIASTSESIRRLAVLIVLLIAAFELVGEAKGVTITIGSFQISRNSIVLQFVPVLVAYLILQMTMDTTRNVEMRAAFSELFAKWSAEAGAHDMDLLLHSPMPVYWNVAGAGKSGNRPRAWIVIFALFACGDVSRWLAE
jgi:hypothetical protein